MPELPDLTVYREALAQRVVGQRLERVRLLSPFLLRTAVPALDSVDGRRVTEVRRIGKRLAIGLEGDLWLVFHLMIAGRLHWFPQGSAPSKRAALVRLEFGNGTLTLTEAGTKRRASLHRLQGEQELRRQDPGGLEVLQASRAPFAERLRRARCQTGGRLLADRAFSRLLKRDWPRSVDALDRQG